VHGNLFGLWVGAFFVDDNLDMWGSFLHVLNNVFGSLQWSSAGSFLVPLKVIHVSILHVGNEENMGAEFLFVVLA
jgi:hypothetical protein